MSSSNLLSEDIGLQITSAQRPQCSKRFDNPEDLARQTKWLLNDAAESSPLGAAGKALYEDCFALPHTIARLCVPKGVD
jgi:hypothetical protein